jgi:ribonuclease HII
MRRAIDGLSVPADIALIDGNISRDFQIPAKAVIHGDAISPNIAAASILAKVTRDMIMEEEAVRYPQYGFEIHKGYGTKAHYEALGTYGPSPIHRMTFLKKFYGEK